MKRKKSKSEQRISLETEVVADLEATDAETEAIKGGRSSSIAGSKVATTGG